MTFIMFNIYNTNLIEIQDFYFTQKRICFPIIAGNLLEVFFFKMKSQKYVKDLLGYLNYRKILNIEIVEAKFDI